MTAYPCQTRMMLGQLASCTEMQYLTPLCHSGASCVRRRVGEWFADVNVVNRVAHGGDGVMVWAEISYLNAEIRPMVAMGLWYGQG
jgi:hypothetical protein